MDSFGDPLPGSDKYLYLREVGHGRFSEVYLVREREATGEGLAAMKYTTLSSSDSSWSKYVEREVNALRILESNPHVINLHGVYESEFGIGLCLEYCQTDLTQVLAQKDDPKEEDWIRRVMWNILRALEQCHSVGITHRDVCPNNVLVKKCNTLCLADFGICCRARWEQTGKSDGALQEKLTPGMGTRWYMAPEILFGSTNYTEAIDIWSSGCILAEVLAGRPLFPGNSDLDQICKIIEVLGTPNPIDWPGLEELPDWGKLEFKPKESKDLRKYLGVKCSDQAFELLESMLQYNPSSRTSAKDALQNSWFQGICEPCIVDI